MATILSVSILQLCLMVCISLHAAQQTTLTYKGDSTTVRCPLQGVTFPDWHGPPEFIAYYLGGLKEFNPNLPDSKKLRLSIATDDSSLAIANTTLDDHGTYRCRKGIIEETNVVTIRVRASEPIITSSVQIDSSGLRATEGQRLTITCTSRGGYPVPTVVWYKGSNADQELVQTSSGTAGVDSTFTVTLDYTFTPTRQDDRQELVCRSYWPTEVQDLRKKSVSLYLNLKPNQPSVSQIAPVVISGDIKMECKTSGSRPEVNISWVFRSETVTGTTTVIQDNSTKTFTTVSVLERPVTFKDNGQALTCKVSHVTGELTNAGTMDIQFAAPSSSTKISGNTTIVANGDNPLSLTCTTGSSNPASVITWKKGNIVVNGSSQPSDLRGENNGVIRSQVLTLRPTRDDNGETVTCSTSNGVSTVPDTASLTLAMHFRPIVFIQQPSVVINEQTTIPPVELSCSVDSSPPSNVTLLHNGQVMKQIAGVSFLNFSITNTNRTSYGSYNCTAENGVETADSKTYMVEVQFRPLNITIEKPGPITADGINNMTMSCVTGSSNPAAMVTWSTGNIPTYSPVDSTTIGAYGGAVSRSTITITPTREHDSMTVSCTAKNNLFANQPVSFSTQLDNLIYSPLINTLTDQTVVEGNIAVFKCTAGSKPVSVFMWAFESALMANGSGTDSYNGLNYNITAVLRSQAGIYTCTADNQIPPHDTKKTRLVVQYPPDVVVTAINTTVQSESTTLTCGASGVPDQYTYEGWVHTFNGVNVSYPEPLPALRELTLTGLSYAHSGVYRCGASNGVKRVVSHGENTILVQSFPILIGDIASSKEIKASGQLMKPTVITFQYYSNAGNSSVKVLKVNGTDEEVGEIRNSSVMVKLPVFLSEITTLGTEVTINITVTAESQFGEYQIIVINRIDQVNLSLIIQPLGRPETPTFVNSTVLDHNSVIISWISGFPNGLNQTFVIQISTDNSTWQNTTQYGGMSFKQTHTKRVNDLASSRLYFWRMLAINSAGESQPTGIFKFETLAPPGSTTSSSTGLIVGGAAGGAVAAMLVIAVIIFIVWRRSGTRLSGGKAKDNRTNVISSNQNQGYDDGDEEVENRLYVTAGPRDTETAVGFSTGMQEIPSGGGNIYAKVNKNSEVVYAMPNKQKDGTKAKKRKIKPTLETGDVYENAPSTLFGKKTIPNPGENVYEDTSTTTSAVAEKPTGTDGLLYADLEFAPRKKGPTKIIGIEDRCEYTTIDLTKKAQPLPDSDDENKTNT